MSRRLRENITTNHSLLKVITPMGMKFERNKVTIGEHVARVYGAVKYPGTVHYGWLAKLTNIPNTVASITFNPIDSGEFIDALNRSIRTNEGIELSAKDELTRSRARRAADDGKKTMTRIDQENETVGLLSFNIMPVSAGDEEFERVSRSTVNQFKEQRIDVRALANAQKEGYMQISPAYGTVREIEQRTQQILPLDSFMGGFPFSSSGFNDGTGYYFAMDKYQSLIILDLWKRGGDRTNSGLVIMGKSGKGKSTKVKDIALSEYIVNGTKLIFVDPNREYKDIARSLNGDWINAGGGKGGLINPFHIRPVPPEEEEDGFFYDTSGLNDMALHLKFLEVFYSLYLPSLTDIQRAILKDITIELYNNFNITWRTDISKLKNTDFPIFNDLYELLLLKSAQKESERKSTDLNHYSDLAILFKDIAVGGDSFLWNGHTNIQASTNCIVLDTKDLQDSPDHIKRAQYFNLLSWVWQQITNDRKEKVMTIFDEAYLMIDPRVLQTIIFLRNLMKQARKFSGMPAIVSHSLVDFLDPQVKMYGQELLDTPDYKILFGTDGKNLEETKELYKLTETESELLEKGEREHALLFIGSKRMYVHFKIPKYKLDLMGDAGGA